MKAGDAADIKVFISYSFARCPIAVQASGGELVRLP
jgi:hypothetical protein